MNDTTPYPAGRPVYTHGKLLPLVAALVFAFVFGVGPVVAGIVLNIVAAM